MKKSPTLETIIIMRLPVERKAGEGEGGKGREKERVQTQKK